MDWRRTTLIENCICTYRFPTNKEKRNVWLNACNLKVNEYLPSRRICSRHFDEACYSKSGTLKRDSIPTRCVKGQIIQPFFSLLKYYLFRFIN